MIRQPSIVTPLAPRATQQGVLARDMNGREIVHGAEVLFTMPRSGDLIYRGHVLRWRLDPRFPRGTKGTVGFLDVWGLDGRERSVRPSQCVVI